jgi:hypothetical protein
MITELIEKHKETYNQLGAYADSMEIGSKERTEVITKYKSSLLKTETELAKWLHDSYEEIAKSKNWETQKKCKVEFEDLPKENKNTMLELSKRILMN